MEFGIEPHSLFQARGTTGIDHISATLPNARHRRAVFSVQCPARHSGVAPVLGASFQVAGCGYSMAGLQYQLKKVLYLEVRFFMPLVLELKLGQNLVQ